MSVTRKVDNKPKKNWVFIIGGTGEKPYAQIGSAEKTTIDDYIKNDKNPLADVYKRTEKEIEDIKQKIQMEENKKKKDQDKIILKDLKRNLGYLNNNLNAMQNAILVEPLPTTTSYANYMPPATAFDSSVVTLVRGVHSVKNLKGIRNAYDHLTAASEARRIQECMHALRVAKDAGELPERIVLNGHSRGASACIELARAIYLRYGDQIKIDIHINDPVPGPFRHSHSKEVIPPNVESLVITYAGIEDRHIFTPQDLNHLYYDERYTSVNAIMLPVNHSDLTLAKSTMKNINSNLWAAIDEPQPNFNLNPMRQPPQPTSGSRKHAKMMVATDTRVNANLSPGLRAFHQSFTEASKVPVSIPLAQDKARVQAIAEDEEKAKAAAKGEAQVKTKAPDNKPKSKVHALAFPDSTNQRKRVLKRTKARRKRAQKVSPSFPEFNNGKKIGDFPALKGFIDATFNWQADGGNTRPGIFTEQEKLEMTSNILSELAVNRGLEANVTCIHKGNNAVIRIIDPVSAKSLILVTGKPENPLADKLTDSRYFSKPYYKKSDPEARAVLMEDLSNNLIKQANNFAALPSTNLMIEKQNNLKKIEAAANIGKQISELLTYLNGQDIIWKDLKPENILLRDVVENGEKKLQIQITDLKGFVNLEEANNVRDDTTKDYIPEKHYNDLFTLNEPDTLRKKEIVADTWQQIYAHQLAVILYHQVTNTLVKNPQEKKEMQQTSKFDFSDPIFKINPHGKNLQFIISGLEKGYIHHEEAAKLLNLIGNEEQFKTGIKNLSFALPMNKSNFPGYVAEPKDRADLIVKEYIKVFYQLRDSLIKEPNKDLLIQLLQFKESILVVKQQLNEDNPDPQKLNENLIKMRNESRNLRERMDAFQEAKKAKQEEKTKSTLQISRS